MKRFFSILIVLVLLSTCAFADDGVYVPSYRAFMESFTEQVKDINSDLYEAILEDCFADGEWKEPSKYSSNRLYCFTVAPSLTIYEGNNFLDRISIKITRDKYEENKELFKSLILASATSIIPNADEAFKQTLFDNLYYDYVLDSPAGYITMYWNCGVYLFQFNKSSSDFTFEISLSLYEVT